MNQYLRTNFYLLLVVITATISPAFAQQKKISAEVLSYAMPVLKRMEVNPIQRIRFYVPEKQGAAVQQLTIKMDNATAASLETITVFSTGAEPVFSNNSSAANIHPKAGLNALKMNVPLKPGLNYLWLSPVLKENASIDAKIKIEIGTITFSNKEVIPVKSDSEPAVHYTGIALRKALDENVNTYRIPGLTQTNKGTLIAVYDIRYKHSGDLPADIDVGMNCSTDGGQTWEPMKVIMDMGAPHENNGIGDPAVLFDPVAKKIWVAALWSKGNRSIAGSEPGLSPDTTGQLILVNSSDDGKTWSAPINITSQVKNPQWHLYFNGPGNGIAMQNGTLVFASQYWDETKKPGIPHSAIIYSSDHGVTWKSGTGAKSNTTESQLVETTPGTLMLNMRDNRGSFRSIATTTDMGKTWLEHPTSYQALIDPVCMASIIKAKVNVKGKMQDVLFFSNMSSSTAREKLTIKASLDMGETWLPADEVLVDQRKSFGYSCLTKIDDNTLGVLYEGIRDLYFVRIPVKDIIHSIK